MNYIVFDLEWNQSPEGKKYSNRRLPFEIIEMGAVKLNEKLEIVDSFHRLIRPQVYKWIHESIREVIHVNFRDLEKGVPFQTAAGDFLEWCTDDRMFFTWGCQDVMELQRNMKFYDLLDLLPGPVEYYDVQKLYAMFLDGDHQTRSLEYAIRSLELSGDENFHRALSDAHYTARVLEKLDPDQFKPYYSLDVYQNPKSKKEEITLTYPESMIFISREFPDRDELLKDRQVCSTSCPLCRQNTRRKVRWFQSGARNYFSLSQCRQHGYVEGKIRVHQTEEDRFFAVKTMRTVTEEEAQGIRIKAENFHNRKKKK